MSKIQICSTAPEAFRLERMSYNLSKVLEACFPPTPYTSVWIEDMYDVEVVHIGGAWTSQNDIKKIPILITAKEIVADFFRAEQMQQKGCFVPVGEPTEQEIETAREARHAWLLSLVDEGQTLFSRKGQAGIQDIPDYYKRAAKELGMTGKELGWIVTGAVRMDECPACAESIKPGVAICKSCGAILDEAKAKKYGLIEEKRGPGRPPKEKEQEVAA